MSLSADGVGGLKVSELKAELSQRGLPSNGVKSTLQKRLIEAINAAAAAAVPEASTGMDVEADAKAPEDEETIDESVRYKGTVNKFFKRRGFGTITPEGKAADDKDAQVFVHWKQIQSSDQWPTLEDGMVVEYYLGEKTNPKLDKDGKPKQKTFAANVTLEGGNPVSTTDTRTYPNKSSRFEGIVKWFDPRKGFGFAKPKEDFCFEEVDFTTDKANIYVCREDIKTADGVDSAPSLKKDAEIEFTLYKKEKTETQEEGKNWGAGEITKPGGEPLGADDFIQRKPRDPNAPRRKKKKKGKKRKANQMFQMGNFNMQSMPMMNMMGGMGMMGGAQPQLVQMNGQTFMMMPAQGMNMMGGGKKKKRRKKKKASN